MQGGALDDEARRRVVVAVGQHALELAQRAQVGGALAGDQIGGVGQPELLGEEELHEEVVAQARGGAGDAEPLLQRTPSRVGEPVDALVGPAVLGDRVVLDELVAREALERDVDLARVERLDHRAEALLQAALDLVPVRRGVGEEREHRIAHSGYV